MKSNLFTVWLQLLAPFLLGALLLLTGIDKFSHMEEFIDSVNTRIYLHQPFGWIGIALVPGLEVVAGITFLNRIFMKETAWLVGFLLVTFLVIGILDILFPGHNKDGCGCHHLLKGSTSPYAPYWHLLVITALMGLNFMVLKSPVKETAEA